MRDGDPVVPGIHVFLLGRCVDGRDKPGHDDLRGQEMLLSLNNIEVVYDRVFLAVKSLSIDVPEGGMVALLGANGAGKSTTLKAISGLLKPERGAVTRGEVIFAGRSVLGLDPPERVRLGLAHVLEGRRVFPQLTPEENLIAATSMHRDRGRVKQLIERTFAWFPRLAERAGAKAGYLSGGEQQMLAIGRALMTEPKLILLDEPSLGLAPLLVDEIFDIIRRINRESSVAVLLVEQNAAMALDIVAHAYLMESGRTVMSGTADVVRQNPDVQAAYLGGSHGVDYLAVKHYRRRKRWLA
jgi:branched-chain amino acid transport system ATP-binding protein